MRAAVVLSLAMAGVATAATSSTCEAQNILDTCVTSIQLRLKACPSNDWSCLCSENTNLLTCYNNCPNDPGRSGVESSKTAYCAAVPSSSTASATAAKTSGSSSSEPTGTSSSTNATSSSPSGSSKPKPTSSSEPTGSNAALALSPVGGFSAFAGLIAVVGAFL